MQKKYDIKEIQKLCSNYCSLGEVLGEGSFGVVFKATLKTKQKCIVALKCINKNILLNQLEDYEIVQQKSQIIDQEINIMTNCNNINILKCFDSIEDDKYRILFLKYCEGGDLYHKIIKQGKIQQRQAIKILSQILVGFASLHKMKVIHRDFKTDNVIIRKGVYKIADFGTAKKIQNLLKSSRGTVVGSRITMSPQVLEGRQYGIQSDMWSLGIVFFEMLFGKLPFMFVINDVQIQKLWDFLQAQSCSIHSKNLLKKMLVIDPNQRLKWIQMYRLYNNHSSIFCKQMFNPNQIKTQQSDDQLDEIYQLKNSIQYQYQNSNNKQFNQNNRYYQSKQLEYFQKYHQDYQNELDNSLEVIWLYQQESQQQFIQYYSKKFNKKFKNKYKLKQEEVIVQKLKNNKKVKNKQIKQIKQNQFQQSEANHLRITRMRALLLNNLAIMANNGAKLTEFEKLNILKLQILINYEARCALNTNKKYIQLNMNNINQYQKQFIQQILKYQQAAKVLIESRNSFINEYQQVLFQYQIKNRFQVKQAQQNRQKRRIHQNNHLNKIFLYRYIFPSYFYNQGKNWSPEEKPLYFFDDHLLKKLKIKFSQQMKYQMKNYLRISFYWNEKQNIKYIKQQASRVGIL